MAMEAVGAYIATLRSLRGISQQRLVEMTGASERGLRNWEKGRNAPGLDDLAGILEKIDGSWIHIAVLMSKDATPEEAEALARRQFANPSLSEDQELLIDRLAPAQRRLITELARELLHEQAG